MKSDTTFIEVKLIFTEFLIVSADQYWTDMPMKIPHLVLDSLNLLWLWGNESAPFGLPRFGYVSGKVPLDPGIECGICWGDELSLSLGVFLEGELTVEEEVEGAGML